jgi:hypothetical protein
MTTPPLSPAAQAVVESALTPFHAIAKSMAAAAIRALVEQTLPKEKPFRGGMQFTPDEFEKIQRQRTRIQQLAIAAELDSGAGQHTTQPTETTNEHT